MTFLSKKKAEKLKISEEVANDQLQLFFDYYEIDTDDIFDGESKAIEIACDRIIKGIRKGKLEIKQSSDKLEIIQTLKSGSNLIYGELTGRTKLAMKAKLDTDNYGKIYALTGSLTSSGEAAIAQLKGADLSLCECIGALFLQV